MFRHNSIPAVDLVDYINWMEGMMYLGENCWEIHPNNRKAMRKE